MRPKLQAIILAALSLLLIIGGVTAHNIGQTHIDWQHGGTDVNGVTTTLVGFTVYCGAAPGQYTVSQFIPDPSTRHVTTSQLGLTDGEWYCRATASNAVGESAPSEELHFFMLGGTQYNPGVPVAPYDLVIGD